MRGALLPARTILPSGPSWACGWRRNGSLWIMHSLHFCSGKQLLIPDERWALESRRHYKTASAGLRVAAGSSCGASPSCEAEVQLGRQRRVPTRTAADALHGSGRRPPSRAPRRDAGRGRPLEQPSARARFNPPSSAESHQPALRGSTAGASFRFPIERSAGRLLPSLQSSKGLLVRAGSHVAARRADARKW